MLAGRLAFELCWLGVGLLVRDELVAVADEFEDVEFVDEDGVGSTVLGVGREMTFLLLGAIPSQMNAKELNAIKARHSPSKRTSSRRSFVRFGNPGFGSSSVGSAVQLLLLKKSKDATVPLVQVALRHTR